MSANSGPLLKSTSRQEASTWSPAQIIQRRDALKAEKAQQIKEGCKLCTINSYNNKIAMLDGLIRKAERAARAGQ